MTDSHIVRYYQQFDENSRLRGAYGELEFVRSMDLLGRHLPPVPARVLDVGGATGPYSEALAGRGYEMHLLDPMEAHVETARGRPGIVSALAGDARELPWPDEFADAVLLMGPLYHLTGTGERLRALREARRVLKPGGTIAAAAISRFASLLDALHRGLIDDPRFPPILLRDLECGEHRNPDGPIEFFTTAYFHLPDQLADELAEAGFAQPEVFAVEGPGWLTPDLEQRWADLEKRRFLLELLRRVEREPALMGASAHVLAFAKAPA
jgi:SAM-dependent methyltransferase